MQQLLLVEDDKGRHEFVLDDPVYTIGRDPKRDIHLVSIFVSPWQATLEQVPNDNGTPCYQILDGTPDSKRSTNGLLINGRRIEQHTLQNEDEIVFGPQVRTIYYLQAQIHPYDGFLKVSSPGKPHPFTPNDGAVASPDQGERQTP